MWTRQTWNRILNWLRQARMARQAAIRARQRSYSVKLELEWLTPRIVPTNDFCTFEGGAGGVGAWNVQADWLNGVMPDNSGTDTVTIAAGATCLLSSSTDAKIAGMTVSSGASLTVAGDLTVAGGGTLPSGNGSTTVASGASLLVGDPSNVGSAPDFNTNTLSDLGTVTVGAPSGGSGGSLSATSVNLETGGIFNIGDPSNGATGNVDVSGTFGIASGAALNVGGSGGSAGSFDVATLNSASGSTTPSLIINSGGQVDVSSTATLNGSVSIPGGVLDAENINAFTGANVVFGGAVTVSNGPILGNLQAGPQASITFAKSSSVSLDSGATLGDGQFYVDGPLAVNTALDCVNTEMTLENNLDTTGGSISGTGSIDWWNHEFDWQGGTIGGLTGGGFTIDGNSDFLTSGSDAKTLATTMTDNGSGTAEFGGTGTLTIDGSGLSGGTGNLINDATVIIPMDMSLPLINSTMGLGNGDTPGTLTNSGYLVLNGSSGTTISAALDNTDAGVIECDTGSGPLTLSDSSGASILNGGISLDNNSLTISGKYTTNSTFAESFSADDSTTLSGTLTIASGGSADFDHLILSGTITGPGNLSINGNGVSDGDSLNLNGGTISGSGTLTIGPYATMDLNYGTIDRDLYVQGTVVWPSDSLGISFGSGTVVDVEAGGLFDYEVPYGHSSVPTLDNSGTLEVVAGGTLDLGTLTQSSTGTLQSDLASASSYGVASVTGTATLAGTLQGYLENSYQPTSGTSFDVLNFASSSGEFGTVEPEGWSADYNSTSVDLVAG